MSLTCSSASRIGLHLHKPEGVRSLPMFSFFPFIALGGAWAWTISFDRLNPQKGQSPWLGECQFPAPVTRFVPPAWLWGHSF